ncbi:TOMM precursor leader peptide-binding protein [Amycolatopsis suaedae]|uniref:TOMM leader peptide-binding protein n=1 Tax=Amycolatopsis suaedae TaxID=2510978 RepID=A0A4V2ELR8_9PSEU|nr:TOMM precursor leader peptide-binding protein [Amycolatopsis suaedae]RZQ62515.1 hypothetical protein EWH70_19905 [Amycolatopsis suaedae]
MTLSDVARQKEPTAGSTKKYWIVNSEARVLFGEKGLLIRQGGVVTRSAGQAVSKFVNALLDGAENGMVSIDTGSVDAGKLAQLERLMDQLVEANLLIEAEDGERYDPVVVGLYQRAGGIVDRATIARRLATREVAVLGTGELADRLRESAGQAGLRVTGADAVESAYVTVVAGAHDDDDLLEEWNQRALAEERPRPWLAVLPFDGERATVGPWVVPGESACYQCYRLRRAAAFPDVAVSEELAGVTALRQKLDNSARYPGLNLVLAGMVTDRITEFAGLHEQMRQPLPGGLTTFEIDSTGITTEHHRVLRVPRCPVCSPAAGRGYPQVWFPRYDDEQGA